MADNTISPVVPNVSGGRNVSTGQKAVTQTAAQSGIDFKSYLGGRTAVQDNSTTFLKRRNSYTLNKNNTKEISIKTASKNSPTESEVKKITDDISSQIVEKVTDDLDISEDELNNAMQLPTYLRLIRLREKKSPSFTWRVKQSRQHRLLKRQKRQIRKKKRKRLLLQRQNLQSQKLQITLKSRLFLIKKLLQAEQSE